MLLPDRERSVSDCLGSREASSVSVWESFQVVYRLQTCPAHIQQSKVKTACSRLQRYDFEVVHTGGSRNPSDFLLRHSGCNDDDRQGALADEYVNFLAMSAVPKAMSLPGIQEATIQDTTLQCVAEMIRKQSWDSLENTSQQFQDADSAELKLFKRVKDELTVNNETNIILRDNCIVVPTVLRNKAISIAHEGHQGLVKNKQLLREKIWFPGIDQDVKRLIDGCIACQANGPDNCPHGLLWSFPYRRVLICGH